MRSILDDGKSWFLESLVFSGDLRAVVVEGVVGKANEDLRVGGKVISGLRPVETTSLSRRVEVCFSGIVAWQVVDESYTAWDKSEERDDKGFLVALGKSAYLRFVDEHHGWYKDMVGPAAHYRLWTEDQVVDVVAHDAPVVHPLRAPN